MPRTRLIALLFAVLLCGSAAAMTLNVVDADGHPLTTVMVTWKPQQPSVRDTSDNGYPQSGARQQAIAESTRFTDPRGAVEIAAAGMQVRLRKPGYRDRLLKPDELKQPRVVLEKETDPALLAAARPANAWFAALDLGDAALKKEFALQCNFCHQQGSVFLRRERSAAEWQEAIKRMVRYGARLSSDAQKILPAKLAAEWRRINAAPAKVPEATPWPPQLSAARITEWPIGDSFSQMHDLLYHSNGRIYIGDNLQDRVYEVDPGSGAYTVYKIPPQPGDTLGGLLAGRLIDFPKHETYNGIHSLAESPRDGHIFITSSYQQRIIEFDPASKQFTPRQMDRGYYPHTIRADAKDRIWFTLALSNQIAMYDRAADRFSYYDLPTRGFMEAVTVKLMGVLLKLMKWGLPIANWVSVDHQSSGVPLPYGIDVTPDGKAWFARLHSDEIGSIDPASGAVTMIKTPFKGPRRLRSDAAGNLWIVAFPESQIVRYEPASGKFTPFDLPVVPRGSDTPYALNVDRARNLVWVNGTNSDSLYRFDIAAQTWTMIPLPRRVTFTRDVEIAPDGRVFTTNSSFPSWHIEDAQPTLIMLTPQ